MSAASEITIDFLDSAVEVVAGKITSESIQLIVDSLSSQSSELAEIKQEVKQINSALTSQNMAHFYSALSCVEDAQLSDRKGEQRKYIRKAIEHLKYVENIKDMPFLIRVRASLLQAMCQKMLGERRVAINSYERALKFSRSYAIQIKETERKIEEEAEGSLDNSMRLGGSVGSLLSLPLILSIAFSTGGMMLPVLLGTGIATGSGLGLEAFSSGRRNQLLSNIRQEYEANEEVIEYIESELKEEYGYSPEEGFPWKRLIFWPLYLGFWSMGFSDTLESNGFVDTARSYMVLVCLSSLILGLINPRAVFKFGATGGRLSVFNIYFTCSMIILIIWIYLFPSP